LRRKQKFITKRRKGRLKKRITPERCMEDDKTEMSDKKK